MNGTEEQGDLIPDLPPEEQKRVADDARRAWLWDEIRTGVPYFALVLLALILFTWVEKSC
jgi:hypothetical protein